MSENGNNGNFNGYKLAAVLLGAVVVAVLAIIVFCHVAVWLMWVGFITVVVLGIWMAVLIRRGVQRIEEETDE